MMTSADAFLPIPAATTFKEQDSQPTLSHRLASSDSVAEKSFPPMPDGGEPEVMDLGWDPNTSKDDKGSHSALDGKVKNDQMWTLIRRFDKQVQHVKVVKNAVPGGLDMNIKDKEDFNPNKLGVNLERLYMSVGIGMISLLKHLARLRSWKEYFRTSCFFVSYFTAWWFDYLLPVFTVLFMVLIIVPRSRRILFPPLPVTPKSSAPMDSKRSDIIEDNKEKNKEKEEEKKNDESKDKTLPTSEPDEERAQLSHNETIEEDASSFVNAFGHIALSSAIGKKEAVAAEGGAGLGEASPNVVSMVMTTSTEDEDANDKAGDKDDKGVQDNGKGKKKKKKPAGEVIWAAAGPATHALGEVADMWERVANALSPTEPFPKHVARLRIAMLLVPVLLVSTFINSYLILKALGFLLGFLFFGNPVTSPVEKVVVKHVREIKTVMQARNTILKGVPTNAQLAVTLLRIGEASMAPLPPPPKEISQDIQKEVKENKPENEEKDKSEPETKEHDHDEAYHSDEASEGKNDDDASKDHRETDSSGEDKEQESEKKADKDKKQEDKKDDNEVHPDSTGSGSAEPKPKKPGFMASFFQYTAAGALHVVLGTDPLRATFGSTLAKRRLGVLNDVFPLTPSGPVEFKARYNGQKGVVLISTAATVPCISFIKSQKQETPDKGMDMDVLWTVSIEDIEEVKKVGGLGWKSRLVVGWAMEKEVVDAIEVTDKWGNSWRATAMPLRDKLFDRLVSMGGQKWEVQ